MGYQSTKIIELGSCAFRQPNAAHNRTGAGNNSERCSKIHGYLLKAKFWFNCNELDDKNWCIDFGGLKELKYKLQYQFDHTLCIDRKDPLLPLFQELHDKKGCDLRIMDGVGWEEFSVKALAAVGLVFRSVPTFGRLRWVGEGAIRIWLCSTVAALS